VCATPDAPSPESAAHARFLNFVGELTDYEKERRTRSTAAKLDLGGTRRLLAALGNPEAGLPIAHIAGTNGKGTTAAILDSILRVAGLRTGVFLSPHVLELGERVQVGGRPSTNTEIGDTFAAMEPALAEVRARGCPPTFFELLTTLALLRFRRAAVDACILEVGLGGRLDCTNVVTPVVTAITSIELEHTEVLGDTLSAIAREKAGILKPGVPLALGALAPEADRVVRARARELGAPILTPARATLLGLDEGGTRANLHTPEAHVHDARIGMVGAHVPACAALALAMAHALARARGRTLSEATVREGLRTAQLRGRFHRLPGPPRTVVDVAHTPAAVEALGESLRAVYPNARVVALLGLLEDKDAVRVAQALAPLIEHAVTAPCGSRRERHPADLAEVLAAQGVAATAGESLPKAVALAQEHALRRGAEGTVLVCGSVYLAGGVLRELTAGSRQGR
jgi:dihydrofolate synthase/folylpolyglutamate synthase